MTASNESLIKYSAYFKEDLTTGFDSPCIEQRNELLMPSRHPPPYFATELPLAPEPLGDLPFCRD